MLTPIALMTALLPGMIAQRLGAGGEHHLAIGQGARCPSLGLSNAARDRADRLCRGHVAAGGADMGVTINNLLPGIHATDRAISLDRGVAKAEGITLEEARRRRAATIPARRYGTAAEFGAACAFLCSQHAGFIVGQNILLDGGATNATHLSAALAPFRAGPANPAPFPMKTIGYEAPTVTDPAIRLEVQHLTASFGGPAGGG